jgi:hypothetical protein
VCVFQVANAPPAFLIHDPRESKKDNGDRPIVASVQREKEKSVGRSLGLLQKGWQGGWVGGWVALVDGPLNRKVLAVRFQQKANKREREFSFCERRDKRLQQPASLKVFQLNLNNV